MFKTVPHSYDGETTEYRLLLKNIPDDKLPYISILTPTKNRKSLFHIAIYCFKNFNYPQSKLQWIIMDDSDNGDDLRDILPKDDRIKYLKVNTNQKLTIAKKRNFMMRYAKHNIIMNMDDDDYYIPESIRARAKVLKTYPKINMVGCCNICCYNSIDDTYLMLKTDKIAEASMMFRKRFWKRRKWNEKVKMGEGILFTDKRHLECMIIPYNFVLYVINHKSNITGQMRNSKGVKLKNGLIPNYIKDVLIKIDSK